MKAKINLLFAFSEKDIHKKISKALNFPKYYGENLDALWDLLLEPHELWEIEFINWKRITKKNKESIEKFKDLFFEAQKDSASLKVSFK